MTIIRTIARDRRDTLGEGTLWCPRDNAVYWCDILERRFNRLSLADDRVESWEMPDVIGWAIARDDAPGFIAGVGRSIVALTLEPFAITTLAELPEPDDNRVNDAKADPAGRIWLGTMPFDCERPVGSVYRFADGRAERVAEDFTIPNGPAIAPDGSWMFQTDTALSTIFRYPIAADGSLGERTPFIRFDDAWGSPDGMTLDADGGLWVACWGGSAVRRFNPDGSLDRSIALPASQITNCTFAGPDLDRMFVTSAADGVDEQAGGALFEVDPGCRGLPTQTFRG